MIEHELFKKQFVGRDGFVWWIGQIVDSKIWKTNIPAFRTNKTDDHRGFGERYRVRIMGYHTADNKALPDNDLPWATVMYPVTAGAGSASASENTQLRQGNFVFGFFLDGEDGQQPVIMGVIGYNSYTAVQRNVPPVPFLPFDGYEKLDKRAQYAVKENREGVKGIQTKSPGRIRKDPQPKISTAAENPTNLENAQEESQRKEAIIPTHQSKLRSQGPNQVKGIKTDIQNLISKIELILRDLSKFGSEQKDLINSFQDKIQKALDEAVKFVSGKIKWIIKELRKNVIEKANDISKKLTFLFMPNERPRVKTARDKVLFGISCLFNKALNGLGKLVGKFLKNIAKKAVNVTECLLENFVGGFLGKITGIISGALNALFKPLNSITNLIKGIGGVSLSFNAIGEIFDTVKGILGFSFCETKIKGPSVDVWSIWDGPGNNGGGSVSLKKIIKNAKKAGKGLTGQFLNAAASGIGVVDEVTGAVGDVAGLVSGIGFDDLFDGAGCGVGPVPCGPPTVSFFGGGGVGAAANAIVSQTGQILGVDILSSGSGYTEAPFISIGDPCGKGKGAVAKVVLNNNNRGGQGSGIDLDSTLIDASTLLTGSASGLSNGQPITLPETQTTPTDQSSGQTGVGGQVPFAGNDGFTGTPIEVVLLSSGTGYADGSNVSTTGGTGEGLTVNIETTIDAVIGEIVDEIGQPPAPDINKDRTVRIIEGIKLTAGGVPIQIGTPEFTKPSNLSKTDYDRIVNNFDAIDIDGDGFITNTDSALLAAYSSGITDFSGIPLSPDATRTTNAEILAHIGIHTIGGTGILDVSDDGVLGAIDSQLISTFASANPRSNVANVSTKTLTVGGIGGTNVFAGELPITAGGIGGIPVVSEVSNVKLTSGIKEIRAGATGGEPVKAGAFGGRIVTMDGTRITVGDNGGEFIIAYQEKEVTAVYQGNETNPEEIIDGSIISIEIFDPGDGYQVGDIVTVDNGSGATFRIEKVQGPSLELLDKNTESPGGVAKVIILDPGTGYLSGFDGDEGGDGRIWKTKEQTSVRRENFDYDRPYNPGQVIKLNPGDEVCMPAGTSEKIFGPDGNVLENIPGGVCYKVSNPAEITAPQIPDDLESPLQFPTSGNGQYPVVLCLDEIYIKDSGFDYSPGDTIVMEPNYGAVLEPVFDENGSLAKVNIIKNSEGFLDLPEIFIDSETGYNAKLIPVFSVCRIGDLPEDEISPGQNIISVVDCVGKF
jgi:ElaB/YqjD/DUF883 family membrane-anchored ribosome-binding protein